VSVFLVNRSDAELGVSVIISDAAAATVLSAVTVGSTGSDADYVAPGVDSAAPQRLDDCRIVDGRLVATLQPGSWSAVALSVGAGAGRA
jgi:hypothetical protein